MNKLAHELLDMKLAGKKVVSIDYVLGHISCASSGRVERSKVEGNRKTFLDSFNGREGRFRRPQQDYPPELYFNRYERKED